MCFLSYFFLNKIFKSNIKTKIEIWIASSLLPSWRTYRMKISNIVLIFYSSKLVLGLLLIMKIKFYEKQIMEDVGKCSNIMNENDENN